MKESQKAHGKPLKTLIEQRGLSQKELAVKTGIAYSAIKYYVAGQRTPGLDSAAKMCQVLGVSFKTLSQALGVDISGIPDDEPLPR